MTAPNLEEIEKLSRKPLGGNAGREWPVVERAIICQPAGRIATWEAISQIDFEKGGRTQAQPLPVEPRIVELIEKIHKPLGFEA